MKLISWNVNGLRACMDKGFKDFLNSSSADIICVQETKMQKEQKTFDFEGYEEYWNSADKKGYSGTAVFTKIKPVAVTYDMGIDVHDHEGRIINLEFEDFFLVNVYAPNSQSELKRLEYRMQWQDDFKQYLNSFCKPVIVCGDLNVAHREIDLKNPKTNVKNAGFTPQERDKMTELLNSGFVDTYRHFYPDLEGVYSWWSYRFKAREKKAGWRIDYFLASENIIERVKDSFIMTDVYGSDHCPVGIILD